MPETARTICIVEDDASVRRALQRLLRSVGLVGEAFATAEEFLQSLPVNWPSCLILDLNLPGLSGLECQRRLRAAGWSIPVVVITAHASDRVREQALSEGAIAFLPKPFDELSLLQVVWSVVNESGTSPTAVT